MVASSTNVRVGINPPLDPGWWRDRDRQVDFMAKAAEADLDHLVVADHVSFRDGSGADGLIQAAVLLGLQPHLDVYVGVYLLALRHPVLVARQLATLSERAPGRLILGVGVGGEDRHEFEVAGVDPASRGRRTEEALGMLARLSHEQSVDHHGEFFEVDSASVLPHPDPPVPIVIGGRSEAALRRAALYGDGWLGAWCTGERFAESVRRVDRLAGGRQDGAWRHGYQGWIGLGERDEARAILAAAMEGFYRAPFSAFERYVAVGSPANIAEYYAPYVTAGCREFNFAAFAATDDETIAGAADVKRLLNGG